MPTPCRIVPATASHKGGWSARLKNRTNHAEIPSINVTLIPNRRKSQGSTARLAISVTCPRVIVMEIHARGKPRHSR